MLRPLIRSLIRNLTGDGVSAGSGLILPPSNLTQLLLKDGESSVYYPDSHLLKDFSSTAGSLRTKRLGYCYDFDGEDAYVDLAASKVLSGSFLISARMFCNGSITTILGSSGTYFQCSGTNRLFFRTSGTFSNFDFVAGVFNAWHTVVVQRDDSNNVRVFMDGIESTTGSAVMTGTFTIDFIGARSATLNWWDGQLYDIRVYEGAAADEAAANVAGIYDFTYTGTPSAHYPLQEESGPIAYDISGNGNHGTIENAVTSGVGSIHQPDAGVRWSYPNEDGYTALGDVIVPARSSSRDAVGGTLTHTGRCPNYGLIKDYAWQGDGSAVYVDLDEMPILGNQAGSAKLYYFHETNDTTRRIIFSHTNTSGITDPIRLTANGFWTAARSGDLGLTVTGSSEGISLTSVLNEQSWNKIELSWDGLGGYTLACNGQTGSYNDVVRDHSGRNLSLLGIGTTLPSDGAIGPVSITTGGVTTTYAPIPGTRHVAKLVSDGTGSIITDAVKNGVLANLHTLGDGSWRSPAVENGAQWDGTSLVPAAPGATVAANGNAINIPAGKLDRVDQLRLDPTGGVLSPHDYETGLNHLVDSTGNQWVESTEGDW